MSEQGNSTEQARALEMDARMAEKLNAYAVCPRCGEAKSAHTWFGRVLDNPMAWHAFSAFERPSEVE